MGEGDAKRVVVTGGAGFIGSCVIRQWLAETPWHLLCLDRLSYAGNLSSLAGALDNPRCRFLQADVADGPAMARMFAEFAPDAVVHLAAETHVDRSIRSPGDFIHSNLLGTFQLLEAARGWWGGLPDARRAAFRFLHISTDEVYGSLEAAGRFAETSAYAPNSPYSASKAGSDHLVRAWHRSYELPVLTTNSSNNYGPYQFPEKLIPLMILNATRGEALPVYGDGGNVRDWLHVEDHARALRLVLERGRVGETYCIGGRAERSNLQVVEALCVALDELRPQGAPHRQLIKPVADRPGHDRRQAIDCGKIERELGWQPGRSFDQGLRETVRWYLDHLSWVAEVTSGGYRDWVTLNYANRT